MAMLAGPKRRQKWTLNPRGKQWSEDSNKFGQKMLEKMGWTSGKGLGAKEQGITEHVRVRVKNDSVGVGYKKDRNDQWTERQDEFNSFLQNLQKEQFAEKAGTVEDKDKVLSGVSLEEKSKLSQKRVHYKKFTRGKDVNKYNAKDLANIFGKKELNEKYDKKDQEEEQEETEENICDPIGSKDTTAGVLTIKGGNINDYFQNKLSKNQQNDTNEEKTKSKSKFYVDEVDAEAVSEDESERFRGFGFKKSDLKSKKKKMSNLNYVFDNPCLDLNILDSPEKTKPKNVETATTDTSRKRKSEFNNEGFNLTCSDGQTPKKRKNDTHLSNDQSKVSETEPSKNTLHSQIKVPPKIKIKSDILTTSIKFRKENKLGIGVSAFESSGLDLTFLDHLRKNKLKKEKCSELQNNFCENQNLESAVKIEINDQTRTIEDSEVDLNILKNIKKEDNDTEILSNGFENHALDLNYPNRLVTTEIKEERNYEDSSNVYENQGLDLNFPECSNRQTPKKIKKIKDYEISSVYENPGLDLNYPDRPTPKKIKNKKDYEVSNVYENPGLDLNYPDRLTPKKIKKEKDYEVLNVYENPGLDLTYPDRPTPKKIKKEENNKLSSNVFENLGLDVEFPVRLTPKKIKKEKVYATSAVAFVNPALDLNSSSNETPMTMDFEVLRTDRGLENCGLDLEEDNSSKKVTFNSEVEYSTDIMKKKKKKNKLDKYEVVNKKIKKKNTLKEPVTSNTGVFVNEALDVLVLNEEEIDNELNERKSKKCKRRKERRISLFETIVEDTEEENVSIASRELVETDNLVEKDQNEFSPENTQNLSDNLSKKKRKKKKDKNSSSEENGKNTEKHEDSIVVMKKRKNKKNISEEDLSEIQILEEPSKNITKEKRKKIEDKIEVPEIIEVHVEKINKKKKKKKIEIESSDFCESNNTTHDTEKENICDDEMITLNEFLNEKPVAEKKSKSHILEFPSHTINEIKKESRRSKKKNKEIVKRAISGPVLLFNGSNIHHIPGYGIHRNEPELKKE